MTLYCYMCRSWQDCCSRGENRSWPSVSVESVDSECWCLNSAIFYAFIMRLTVEERVFILESYLKTMSYVHCRQSFFEKFRRQVPVKSEMLFTGVMPHCQMPLLTNCMFPEQLSQFCNRISHKSVAPSTFFTNSIHHTLVEPNN